jgi:hypothetical protein
MLTTVLGALLPIVVTILLGFVAAWHHDFDAKEASILNRMVLLYAVPMGLFVGTLGTRREVLSQDFPLVPPQREDRKAERGNAATRGTRCANACHAGPADIAY